MSRFRKQPQTTPRPLPSSGQIPPVSRIGEGLLPWIFIGALIILLPIFAFSTLENIQRSNENSARLLMEKGAALIRSFEAGTRIGMDMQWSRRQLQNLIKETAKQPDIVYIFVSDAEGRILAHSSPGHIGKTYTHFITPCKEGGNRTLQRRIVDGPDNRRVFEVFREFIPAGGTHLQPQVQAQVLFYKLFRASPDADHPQAILSPLKNPLVIYTGFDMSGIEAAREKEARSALLMGAALLSIALAGFILLIYVQNHQATRALLTRIKAFSDNVVENMPIGLIAMDPDNRISTINSAAEGILGLEPAKATGKRVSQIMPPDLRPFLRSLPERRGPVETEIECQVAPNRLVPLEVNGSVLRDADGGSHGSLLLIKDLSEVKDLKREVAKSQRLASIGKLAAGVAHEIRNPLSSVKGFATYFKDRYRDVPEDQEIADIMIQEVDRLNRVVTQLLELSKPITLTCRDIPLQEFLNDSLRLINTAADAAHVKRHLDLKAEDCILNTDADRLSQVLLNLYLNAIEAMPQGGDLTIGLFPGATSGQIVIRVTDTGTGIDPSNLAHIFDPYFTTKSTGTGLGLAIVHNIVEALHGRITVRSREGKGTAFNLYLPLNPAIRT
ncbi:MAG: PAS domain-containing sensor histidine kinase [Deltaproteobacteria bacterium]|nr:MAG: PAS domain-containing sensor histidine kinase [Deltaproteobacteria bacterium]